MSLPETHAVLRILTGCSLSLDLVRIMCEFLIILHDLERLNWIWERHALSTHIRIPPRVTLMATDWDLTIGGFSTETAAVI